MNDRMIPLKELLPIIEQTLAEGKTVRFTPEGTSMRPMLTGGQDSVVLAPLPDRLRRYDAVLYRRDNGQFVLHRVLSGNGREYICMGDAQFAPERVRQDQMLAVVQSFTHRGKQIPVSSAGYRLYCRLWCGSRPARHFAGRASGWLRRRLCKIHSARIGEKQKHE